MKLYWILDELLTPIAVHSDTYARWMQEQTARGEMNLCLVERTEFPRRHPSVNRLPWPESQRDGAPRALRDDDLDRDGVAWPYRRTYHAYDEARAGHLRARAHVHAQR